MRTLINTILVAWCLVILSSCSQDEPMSEAEMRVVFEDLGQKLSWWDVDESGFILDSNEAGWTGYHVANYDLLFVCSTATYRDGLNLYEVPYRIIEIIGFVDSPPSPVDKLEGECTTALTASEDYYDQILEGGVRW